MSLLVAVASVGCALVVGVPIGLVAGYRGRKVGCDPYALHGRSAGLSRHSSGIGDCGGPWSLALVNTIIAIAVINTPTIARVARAQAMIVSRLDYVKANRALGFGDMTIMLRCVLPNTLSPVLVQASLMLASSIITESYLSFLGLGVQAADADVGQHAQGCHQLFRSGNMACLVSRSRDLSDRSRFQPIR